MKEHEKKAEAKKGKALKEKALKEKALKEKGCGSPFQGYRRKEGKRRGIDENGSYTAPADTPDVRESGNWGEDHKKPENPAYGRSVHNPVGAGKNAGGSIYFCR